MPAPSCQLLRSPLPRRAVATTALALAATLGLSGVASTANAKPKGYTVKGKKKHASGGGFSVRFTGEGNWNSTVHSLSEGNNLKESYDLKETSTYKWDLSTSRDQALNVPWPCKAGTSNLCKGLTGSVLDTGKESLNYSVNDVHNDFINPPDSVACGGSLEVDTATAPKGSVVPNVINVSSKSGTVITASIHRGDSPFIGSTSPGTWIAGAACHGILNNDLWEPGGDGSFSTGLRPGFFQATSVTIPISVLASAQSVTVGLSGPGSADDAPANCGLTQDSGTTCNQSGSWRGKVTFTRLHG